MVQSNNPDSTSRYRTRRSFAKIPAVMDVPNLIAIQTESFKKFMDDGLTNAFADISPIESNTKDMCVEFGKHEFGEPKYSVDECKERDVSYQAPLFAEIRFINRETGEIKEQDVFMGDFPLMTPRGTFIINGTERVVVSQLVRSPGVYFSAERDKTSDKTIYNAKIIPSRGAWLEFETDKRDILSVRIDRKRKQPATLLLRALGIAETREEIIDILGDSEMVIRTLDRDPATTKEESLIELYRRFRPGEPPTIDSARTLLDGLFFNPQRYDLAKVGRYKINKKLEFDPENDASTLTQEDIIATMRYIVGLHDGAEGVQVDDIDHFGNRRIRTVGELIQNQFRIGLSRMERVVRERMSMQEPDDITPQSLVNIRPIVAAIKEFFGSSQLSQFMDQSNIAAGVTHKRRLSALGPGGLSRERAGFEVRDVHNSHYSRMCPIETPEGPNIGLIGSLATYARVNDYGFIEAPYRRVEDGKVTDIVDYLTADEEEKHTIAQANEQFDPETRVFGHTDENGTFVPSERLLCRTRDSKGVFGEPEEVTVDRVDYMDVSPRQMTSVATSLIPFLEHDDANRALMGSNMQRQAVPLLRPSAPLVGTGIEHRIAVDSGEVLVAQNAGVVDYVDGQTIIIEREDGEYDEYLIPKFQRSNQSGCMNHKPIVRKGDKVYAGDVLADGPSCDGAELSLGQNLMVAYMPWEGYNYEDAIIVSERVVAEDLLTSIHISEYEIDARDTKLGPEEITREVPNISDDMVSDLDSDGIIRVGAEVFPGDVLVGKVTPKGETELTPEERLLRAIFGDKEREVRDTSLRVPHGEFGKVVDVKVFTRENGDELAPGVNKLVRVYIAQKRKIREGDKMAGRHGNKCVCSRILPVEDMPFTPDGRPVDLVLNPLGVPSRMNIGQILEIHLSWACHMLGEEIHEALKDPAQYKIMEQRLRNCGYDFDQYGMPEPTESGIHIATPVFDGCRDEDLAATLKAAGLPTNAKTDLYDGRTGEKVDNQVTIGWKYMLKLHHLVDDKIHARSTGPYSLVTQQPLGGKAQFGGQRFGEMEVWALEAYGAAYTLQEILTVKSDDVIGRVKAYEKIFKGENIPSPGVPESFKVLMKELQSIGLDVRILNENGDEVVLKELDEEDMEQGYGGGERWHRDEVKEAMEGDTAVTESRNAMESSMTGAPAESLHDDVASFNDALEAEVTAPAYEEAGFNEEELNGDSGHDDDRDE